MGRREKKPGVQSSRGPPREDREGKQKREYQKALEGLFGVKMPNEKAAAKKPNP
jgi:hypothetical protein